MKLNVLPPIIFYKQNVGLGSILYKATFNNYT